MLILTVELLFHRNLLPLAEFDIGSTQHRNNLVNSITLLCHLKNPFRALPGLDSLTSTGTFHRGKVRSGAVLLWCHSHAPNEF